MAGIAQAGAGAAGQGLRNLANKATAGASDAFTGGKQAALTTTGGKIAGNTDGSVTTSAPEVPDWAQRMRSEQRLREGASVVAHTIGSGDQAASGENPKLREDD
jgi:type IV secretion system protein TrbL